VKAHWPLTEAVRWDSGIKQHIIRDLSSEEDGAVGILYTQNVMILGRNTNRLIRLENYSGTRLAKGYLRSLFAERLSPMKTRVLAVSVLAMFSANIAHADVVFDSLNVAAGSFNAGSDGFTEQR
jgi:hypothetical protein